MTKYDKYGGKNQGEYKLKFLRNIFYPNRENRGLTKS